jgi:hypothetical protein
MRCLMLARMGRPTHRRKGLAKNAASGSPRANTVTSWLQPLAWSLPSAYVFEGMRAVLFAGRFRLDLLVEGGLRNLVLRVCQIARERGLLVQQGE